MGPDQLVFFWMIIMTVAICALLFGIRYMRNRETIAMIEKGMDPKYKPERPRPAPFRNLKWGLLFVGAGIGLFLAYLLDNTILYRVGHYVSRYGGGDSEVNGANVAVYFALIAIGGGLGLIASYRVEKKELLDKEKD
jgi:multisubunit Na+/H+ antiporter MnhB subunit